MHTCNTRVYTGPRVAGPRFTCVTMTRAHLALVWARLEQSALLDKLSSVVSAGTLDGDDV